MGFRGRLLGGLVESVSEPRGKHLRGLSGASGGILGVCSGRRLEHAFGVLCRTPYGAVLGRSWPALGACSAVLGCEVVWRSGRAILEPS